MGGNYFVFDTFVVILKAVLRIIAFENIEVFDLKLIPLAPSNS